MRLQFILLTVALAACGRFGFGSGNSRSCTEQDDCSGDAECVDRVCVETCVENSDCSDGCDSTTATGQVCNGGLCLEAECASCDGATCAEPPPPVCVGDILRSFESIGTCAVGQCSYEVASNTVCQSGCESGACIDSCAGVVCDTPPADACEGQQKTVYGAGACVNGVCEYPPTTESCQYHCRDNECLEDIEYTVFCPGFGTYPDIDAVLADPNIPIQICVDGIPYTLSVGELCTTACVSQ